MMKSGGKLKNYIILISIFFLIMVPSVFLRYPDDRNELKYFVILDEMIKNRELLVMKYFGELYPDKPPLYFWLLYFLRDNFKENFFPLGLLFGSVVPSFLVSLLTLNIFGSLLFPLILISIPFFVGTSLLMRMDMMMSIFILLSLMIFYRGYFVEKNFTINSLLLMYLSMGMAVLTKGGAGIAIPLLAISTLFILDRNFRDIKKIKIGWGIFLVIGMLGIWLGTLYFKPQGKEYISLLLGRETLGRALNSHAHGRPFYFYMLRIPAVVAPYPVLFLTGLFCYLKDLKNFSDWTVQEKISFTWFLGPFIFLSLMSGKLDIYLLPLYPAIAGILGCFYLNPRYKKAFNFSLIASLISMLLIGAIGYFIPLPKGIEISKFHIILGCLGILFLSIQGLRTRSFSYFIGIPFLIFALMVINLRSYTEFDSLKEAEEIIVNRKEKIISYRFSDGLNLASEVNRSFAKSNSLGELSNIYPEEKELLVLGKTKYFKDFNTDKNFDILAKNNKFFLLLYKR